MERKSGLGRRIGWLAVAIAPPSLLGAASLAWVKSHPVAAIGLAALYEVLLAIAAFAGDVAGDLRRRWRDRFADRLDQQLVRRVSGFSRRYRSFLLSSLRYIDLKGLATIGYYTPELDEVFVDVSLAFRAPHQVSGNPLAEPSAEIPQRRSVWSFFDLPRPVVLALIGAAGSGKTTLLRHTARRVGKSRGRRRNVPVLLYLRDHANTIVDAPQTRLSEIVSDNLGGYGVEEPPGWFEQKLQQGRCLVLLDGLDEVAKQNDRRSVVDWVDRQIKQYPRNDFIITSRPHGYHTAPLDAATVVQVLPFTDQQVTRFLHGWYLAVERHSAGTGEDAVRSRAQREADDLLQRLRNAPALYDLTVNPLLLTMIANVHRYRGALPGSRADLYAEICQVLLWRRQEAKKLQAELRGDQKEVVLRELAFDMMQFGVRDLGHDEVLRIIGSALPRVSTALIAEEFLTDATSSGLLIERENGIYAFAHQTFQEYLAASHIREKGKTAILAEAVENSWWRDAILLYVAHTDAGPIVEECLSRGTVKALALAFDCAEEASELAPQLRARLDGLLAGVSDTSADPAFLRLRAGVLATRHLRDRARVAVDSYLCLRPISVRIYRLFLRDVQAGEGKWTLDWPDPVGPRADEEIALGMRGSDAVAFVHWLNGLTDGEPAYRLPTRAEIEDFAARRAPGAMKYGIWVSPNSRHDTPELWMPPGINHPHAIDEHVLCNHLKIDIDTTSLASILLLIRARALLRGLVRVRDRARDLSHELMRDVERARERAYHRAPGLDALLDVAIDRADSLNRDLKNALILLDRDLVSDLARDFGRALSSRTNNLDPSRVHTLARALMCTQVLVDDIVAIREFEYRFIRDLDVDLTRAVGRVRDITRRINLVHVIVLELEPNLELVDQIVDLRHDLVRGLDQGLSNARSHDLVRDLALKVDLDFDLDRKHDIDAAVRDGLASAVGTALSRSLSAALSSPLIHPGSLDSIFLGQFCENLIKTLDMTTTTLTVSIDGLADHLAEALEAFRSLRIASPDNPRAVRLLNVASRLESIALPILNQQQQVGPEDAAFIRIAAIYLAAEMDRYHPVSHVVDLKARLREIAAGVTLLERRQSGQVPAIEALFLALA